MNILEKRLDFRSDTVTLPTDRMLEEINRAELGDDVYGDDVSTNKLETLASKILGKEDGLFVPTGTMGNLIAVMTHTRPGQEIILEQTCHIYIYEVAGIARLANVQAKLIKGNDGVMDPVDIKNAIRKENIHFPETGLIAMENTHNVAGGMVIPLNNMEKISEIARENKIPVHLDGARIFNAAHHLNVDVKEIAKYADSVMFCFSKGLGAPVGSMLVGDYNFISRARKYRKMLGGGMRQVGIISSAAIVALEEMVERLPYDHENAKLLGELLNQNGKIIVETQKIHTNIINVDFSNSGINASKLLLEFKKNGLLVTASNEHIIRFVTHKDISSQDVIDAANIVNKIIK